MIFGIDPGPQKSGWELYSDGRIGDSGVADNYDLLRWVQAGQGAQLLGIEMIESFGMPVGREVFETVRWIGRFQQAWADPESVILVHRHKVKLHLCQSPRAKDANIRQALIDRLGPRGTKKAPGPTYGVSSHAWPALAVAVVVADTCATPKRLEAA
jgi:hypothetical protein